MLLDRHSGGVVVVIAAKERVANQVDGKGAGGNAHAGEHALDVLAPGNHRVLAPSLGGAVHSRSRVVVRANASHFFTTYEERHRF